MFARLLTGTLLLGFGLLLGGCDRSGVGRRYEVSGKVTYKGKPVPGGVVMFMTTKGFGATGNIDPDTGAYKLEAPVGEAKITVDNNMLKAGGQPPQIRRFLDKGGPKKKAEEPKPATPTLPGKYVPLPEKYRAPDSSGLTYTVEPKVQTHDIELKD